MIQAFQKGANSSGRCVKIIDVCSKQIKGCLVCEYCHTKNDGKCIQKDNMQVVNQQLHNADMLVLDSPIYYHGRITVAPLLN